MPADLSRPSRLALVTGGSRGLGAALVAALRDDDWQVVEHSRTAPHADSVRVDLADPLAACAAAEAALARLDLSAVRELYLIANAGTLTPIGPTARQPPDALLQNLHTNVVGPVLLLSRWIAHCQALPARKRIAHISSGAARTAYPGWSLYGLAKAGMEQHLRCIAAEQAGEAHPFTAVDIVPGVIDTAMQDQIRATPEADFPLRERFVQRHAAGELRAPAVVARAVLRILARDDLQGGERYDVADHLGDDGAAR